MTEPVYHLAEPDDWARRTTHYQPASFAEEGLIRCSTVEQLPLVAAKRYPERSDMVLLEIDTAIVGDEIVFEDPYDLGEEYPHIYAPIPVSAVVSAEVYRASR